MSHLQFITQLENLGGQYSVKAYIPQWSAKYWTFINVCVCNMRKVHSLTPINEVRRGFLWCVTDGTHRIHTTTTNIGSNEK